MPVKVKQSKPTPTPRRFKVYVQSTTTGHITRGRYYNRGVSAWRRAKELRNMLTDKFLIVIYQRHDRKELYSRHGYTPHRQSRMCIFSPVQSALGKA